MRDLTALEQGNLHTSIVGGIVDAFGGGQNRRTASAAEKLIAGVRQGTAAEIAGLDAARAAALGGAVGGGIRQRQGIADVLAFLTGQQVAPARATDFGISPTLAGAEFARASGDPLKVFGEDGGQPLLGQGALDLTRAGLLTGLRTPEATGFDPNTPLGAGVASRTAQPQQAIDPTGVATTGQLRGGLLGTVRQPFQPFVEAGQQAAGALQNPLAFLNDPGMQFRLQQGQQAIERSAAARGGLVSGRTLQDVNRFAQGVASDEFGNAFNRALATAGLGLGATGTQAGLTTDVGGRIMQSLLGLRQQESDIAREVADISAQSALGAGQAIANRERLLGEIKAGKKASQLTAGEQVDAAISPLVGTFLSLATAAGGGSPNLGGFFGGGGGSRTFQRRQMTPSERLISSFGVEE